MSLDNTSGFLEKFQSNTKKQYNVSDKYNIVSNEEVEKIKQGLEYYSAFDAQGMFENVINSDEVKNGQFSSDNVIEIRDEETNERYCVYDFDDDKKIDAISSIKENEDGTMSQTLISDVDNDGKVDKISTLSSDADTFEAFTIVLHDDIGIIDKCVVYKEENGFGNENSYEINSNDEIIFAANCKIDNESNVISRSEKSVENDGKSISTSTSNFTYDGNTVTEVCNESSKINDREVVIKTNENGQILEKSEKYDYNKDGVYDESYNHVYDYDKNGDIILVSEDAKLLDLDKNIDFSSQGYIGDCYLLSSLNALSYNEKGQEKLAELIKENDDGSFSVEFKGLNKEFNVTQEEITEARKKNVYSTGDNTVLLFELAYKKAYEDIVLNGDESLKDLINADRRSIKDGEEIISGGNFFVVSKLLFNEYPVFFESGEDALYGLYAASYDNLPATLNFAPSKGEESVILKDVNGNEIVMTDNGGGHVWAFKSLDEEKETVTVINPWDSSVEYEFDINELCDKVSLVCALSIQEDDEGEMATRKQTKNTEKKQSSKNFFENVWGWLKNLF